MQLPKSLFIAALATLAAANSANFVNQDGTIRHVVFTPSEGFAQIDELTVPGNSQATVEFPSGWNGNAYSYDDGQANVPGILAEFAFNGYAGVNFFDISSIVNPQATDGIIMMYPTQTKTPVSGCLTTACSNQYNQPDDVATQAASESDFTLILGQRIQSARRSVSDIMARAHVQA